MDVFKLFFKLIAQALIGYSYIVFTTEDYNLKKIDSKKKFILLIFCIGIAVTMELLRVRIPNYLLYSVCILPLILIFKKLLKYSNSSTLVSILMLYINISFCEILAYISTSAILNYTLDNYSSDNKFFFSYAFFKIMYVIILFSLEGKYMKIHKEKMKKIIDYLNTMELSIITLLVLCGIVPIFLKFWDLKTKVSLVSLCFWATQILFLTVLIYLYFKYAKYYKNAKQELDNSKLYIKSLSDTVDNLRLLKHDYNNILQSINGYIITQQYSDLNSHINNLIGESQKISTLEALNPKLINQPAIYGVISSKYYNAESKNIKINLDVFCDIHTISCNFTNLSKILGILLDNAIEASEKSEDKKVDICFKTNQKLNADVIEIKNSIKEGTIIDVKTIFDKGVSSKKVKSGLGLWEINKMISMNKNTKLYTNVDGNTFSQKLIIKKNA